MAHLDEPVHAIAEDKRGHLWFAATRHLLELDGSRWRWYPIPAGFRSQTVHTDAGWPLPDGRVALLANEVERVDRALLFDPATRPVARLLHPGGIDVVLVTPGRHGSC